MVPRGLIAAAIVAAPVAVGVLYSAAAATGLAGYGSDEFSLSRIVRVLGEAAVWESLGWSVWVGGAATLLAGAMAVAAATLFRSNRLVDRAARGCAILPLPIPHLVAAATAVLILGQSGLLARVGVAAGLIDLPADMPALVYDRWGIGLILTLAWKEFPFLALLAFSILATRGAALEETARSLGAGPGDVFRHVTWPILWRGLIPGAAAVFSFAVGSYETAILLAPSDPLALPLLTAERYADADLTRRADGFVLSLLAIGVSAAAVAIHEWARSRWEPFAS